MNDYDIKFVEDIHLDGKPYMFKIQKYETNEHVWIQKIAFSKDGKYYIGEEDTAKLLTEHYKISRFFSSNTKNVSNFGFSKEQQKYYGWSHRAIAGYGIGDKNFNETKIIETLQEAKENAIKFAKSVS